MNEQVLYEKKEIYIHEETNDESIETNKIGGRLQIVKTKQSTYIRFLQYGFSDQPANDDWAFVVDNSVLTFTKDSKDDDMRDGSVSLENRSGFSKYSKLKFDINELSSVKRIYPGHGIPSLIFFLNDTTSWPPLFFYKGGSKEFLQELKQYFLFRKDPTDSRLWSVQRPDGQAFQKSLYELSLFEEQHNDVVKKFLNQPIQSTLLGFSKVTNIFRDALKPSEPAANQSSNLIDSINNKIKRNKSGSNLNHGNNFNNQLFPTNKSNLQNDDLNDLMDSLPNDNIHSTNNEGYEMVTKVDLGPMPLVQRGPCVNKSDFQFDKDGKVLNVNKLRHLIFRGGIDHSLRAELWKFMLNYYDWNSTVKSRNDKRKIRIEDYFRMKLQWKTINDEQKSKFALMKERESLIEKDVQRTDRTNEYFEGENNPNLNTMRDILMTYNMFNFDLGYVQGMSDLLAPIMTIMDNEVDSFWCFVGFMDKIESNFLMNQLNIKKQLSDLKEILEFFDSKFSLYLEKNDSSNMYFCFRWILILFKREFQFPDIMTLWEVLWTDLPCKNFHLLICISILLMKKDTIMGNNFGFNEILKYINDLSFKIELEKTLEHAEGLYLQIKSFKSLPDNIREIFELPLVSNPGVNIEEHADADRNTDYLLNKPDETSSSKSIELETQELSNYLNKSKIEDSNPMD